MLGCGSSHNAAAPDAGPNAANAGTKAPSPGSTGTGGTSPSGMPPTGTGGTGLPFPPAAGTSGNMGSDAGGMCYLHVAIACDGDEDCKGGRVCCGTFDSGNFTYTAVACRDTCDGMNEYKLCHPGETCPGMGDECRRSQVIPHDFISVCAAPASVPSKITGIKKVGIVCGDATCKGGQRCCLPGVIESGSGMNAVRSALPAYCVDTQSECACDQGDVDAGADDAG